MQLGCSTILYGGQDLSLALDKIAEAGYKAVEVCAIKNMAPHLNLGEDASYYEGIKAAVADRGLVFEFPLPCFVDVVLFFTRRLLLFFRRSVGFCFFAFVPLDI